MNYQDLAFFYPETGQLKPRIAISACLGGEKVRYDGNSKPLADEGFLQQHFEPLPVCPEVGAGMTVPRPAVQLVSTAGHVRALGRDDSSLDVTDALLSYCHNSLEDLSSRNICGYLFKSRSPSCGINSTPLFDHSGNILGHGSGLQAAYFQQHMPWLVFREESQLNNIQNWREYLWLCKTSSECQRAIEAGQLPQFHHHYLPLWQQLPNQAGGLSPSASDYRSHLLQVLENYLEIGS